MAKRTDESYSLRNYSTTRARSRKQGLVMAINIEVPIEELKKRKLFVAVPMYGGQCAGMFTRSIADLSALCTHYGVQVRFYFLFNESLVTRARNYCADEFMRSGDTHLMFIDSDIGFNPNDVIALLALQNPDHTQDNYDIIAGPYPKKCIAWEKIKLAVDRGFADEQPSELEKYVGDYVFNPTGETKEIRLDEPVEVLEAGTGFMMIRRNTFERFMEEYPQQSYKPDHVRTEAFDGSREIFAFTPCGTRDDNTISFHGAYLKELSRTIRSTCSSDKHTVLLILRLQTMVSGPSIFLK